MTHDKVLREKARALAMEAHWENWSVTDWSIALAESEWDRGMWIAQLKTERMNVRCHECLPKGGSAKCHCVQCGKPLVRVREFPERSKEN